MKVKAPFQAELEHAGQGFDGRRCYTLVKYVLRVYIPMHDSKGVPRIWRRPFVWAAKPFRKY